ncbi:MAG: hypothetical protein JSV30_03365 [Candidatus Omnitrophota bacterium]|nr:MAG: hypothetical protein JSV30_03365 [Candidatus Omnitrophota bacterium]
MKRIIKYLLSLLIAIFIQVKRVFHFFIDCFSKIIALFRKILRSLQIFTLNQFKKIPYFCKDCFKDFLKDWVRSLSKIILNILILILFVEIIINPISRKFFKKEINLGKLLQERYFVFVQDLPKKRFIETAEIKESKLPAILTQEYPSSQDYTYQDSINLITKPAVMTLEKNEQPFWLGIANLKMKENYKNPTLFLNFRGKVNVRADAKKSVGWEETDPNFTYFIKLNGGLQPLVTYRLDPLFVRFPEEGDYSVHFGIRGDNELPVDGDFTVKVRK